jgi:hypothetical protein
MDDDQLFKELEELTRTMENEFKQSNTQIKSDTVSKTQTEQKDPFGDFKFPNMGSEDMLMKELQKLLTADINIDENDAETKIMMKELSKFN